MKNWKSDWLAPKSKPMLRFAALHSGLASVKKVVFKHPFLQENHLRSFQFAVPVFHC